eukprot:5162675-Pyramimonas_sp.AAC.1
MVRATDGRSAEREASPGRVRGVPTATAPQFRSIGTHRGTKHVKAVLYHTDDLPGVYSQRSLPTSSGIFAALSTYFHSGIFTLSREAAALLYYYPREISNSYMCAKQQRASRKSLL